MYDFYYQRLLNDATMFSPRGGTRYLEMWESETGSSPCCEEGELSEVEIPQWLSEDMPYVCRIPARTRQSDRVPRLRVLIGSPELHENDANVLPLPYSANTFEQIRKAWDMPTELLRIMLSTLPISAVTTVQAEASSTGIDTLAANIPLPESPGSSVKPATRYKYRSRRRRREGGSDPYCDGPRRAAMNDPNLVEYGEGKVYGNNYGADYYGRPPNFDANNYGTENYSQPPNVNASYNDTGNHGQLSNANGNTYFAGYYGQPPNVYSNNYGAGPYSQPTNVRTSSPDIVNYGLPPNVNASSYRAHHYGLPTLEKSNVNEHNYIVVNEAAAAEDTSNETGLLDVPSRDGQPSRVYSSGSGSDDGRLRNMHEKNRGSTSRSASEIAAAAIREYDESKQDDRGQEQQDRYAPGSYEDMNDPQPLPRYNASLPTNDTYTAQTAVHAESNHFTPPPGAASSEAWYKATPPSSANPYAARCESCPENEDEPPRPAAAALISSRSRSLTSHSSSNGYAQGSRIQSRSPPRSTTTDSDKRHTKITLMIRGGRSRDWNFCLGLSHNIHTGTTSAVVQGLEEHEIGLLVNCLKSSQEHIANPMLLPLFLTELRIHFFAVLLEKRALSLEHIEYETGMKHGFSEDPRWNPALNAAHRMHDLSKLDFGPITQKLTGLTGTLAFCDLTFEACQKSLELIASVSHMLTPDLPKELLFNLTSYEWYNKPRRMSAEVSVRAEYLRGLIAGAQAHRLVLLERTKAQVQTVYSMIGQRDNRLNIETAAASRRIAEASLADSAAMKHIAEDSRRVALHSRRDSTDMRIIAAMTLVFLPGTFAATLFSSSFFNFQIQGTSKVVSWWIWLYFVVTIGLTFIVLVGWYYFSKKQNKSILRALDFSRGKRRNFALKADEEIAMVPQASNDRPAQAPAPNASTVARRTTSMGRIAEEGSYTMNDLSTRLWMNGIERPLNTP